MADLLASLVTNSPRSSEDSFRSLPSQPRTSSPSPSASNPPSASPTSSTFQASAFQAAGLPISDINTYLTQNAHLRTTPANSVNKTNEKAISADTHTSGPVSLGTKTSFRVAALNQQCQSRGFLPLFEIEGETDFGGALKLRDVRVTSDQRWQSKKEAKEGLAEKGLEVVKLMGATPKEPATSQESGRNWVGMLHEYHNLSNPNLGPTYHDYGLGSAYACTCTMPSLPDHPFGSTTDAFPSKKAARTNAAKEAVEYLILKGELNQDGSTKARKKTKIGAATRLKGRGLEVKKDTTYTQKVNDLCPLLGLTAPHYNLGPASALAPNMVSGYASFPNAPDMPPEIGEVRNVFGKKKAKEELAKEVWQVLEALAAERNVKISEREGSSESSEQDI